MAGGKKSHVLLLSVAVHIFIRRAYLKNSVPQSIMLGISETSQGVLTTDRLIIQKTNILFLHWYWSVRPSIHVAEETIKPLKK